MYRGRRRACPACRGPMDEVGVSTGTETVPVDVCPRCAWVFLEYFDGEPAALARSLGDRPSSRAPIDESPSATPRCPDCDDELERRRYLDHGPWLYRCGGCLAVAAAPAQLDELRAFRATEPREDPSRPALTELFDRIDELVDGVLGR